MNSKKRNKKGKNATSVIEQQSRADLITGKGRGRLWASKLLILRHKAYLSGKLEQEFKSSVYYVVVTL